MKTFAWGGVEADRNRWNWEGWLHTWTGIETSDGEVHAAWRSGQTMPEEGRGVRVVVRNKGQTWHSDRSFDRDPPHGSSRGGRERWRGHDDVCSGRAGGQPNRLDSLRAVGRWESEVKSMTREGVPSVGKPGRRGGS